MKRKGTEQMTTLYMDHNMDPDAPCECGNCDWKGAAAALDAIEDAQERLSPGETVPAGECPECGALAYLAKEEAPAAPAISGDAVSALAAAERFISGFEGDETQDGIADLLYQVRAAINIPVSAEKRDPLISVLSEFVAAFGAAVDNDEAIQGSTAVDYLVEMLGKVRAIIKAEPRHQTPIVAVHVEGGVVQGLSSNDPDALADVRFLLIDYDCEPEDAGVFDVKYLDHDCARAGGGKMTIQRAGVDLPATWENATA